MGKGMSECVYHVLYTFLLPMSKERARRCYLEQEPEK